MQKRILMIKSKAGFLYGPSSLSPPGMVRWLMEGLNGFRLRVGQVSLDHLFRHPIIGQSTPVQPDRPIAHILNGFQTMGNQQDRGAHSFENK